MQPWRIAPCPIWPFSSTTVGAGKTVHHTRILHVRAGTKLDAAEIAAQRCRRAYVTSGTDDNVADQHGAGVHERGRIDDRSHAIDGPDLHRRRILR
jgi:hypothetical protein